ncbi:hypothetical protein JQ557_07245 [Bradyrhizobium sp. U87765 SZCCT0131]|nr:MULTISPECIES: hypothetical protein [unclassified Bradyrhizobium]MBR1217777.1 hypothetical protein [Bradyrhizobium sp. U87765 SZCCT0131]MBR1261277.1 hypothetical protein [Bradyrhizobium sp. U87765 SZCCT0134]MBR1303275.1 hypothetical protein [Bradyrhizobium sp. U87765 SZCCT0110]MBR1318881.1 hypothetical protein [Bradyrhizobium sp. U87765 SZCCT0109]MBR1347206.1 hypothetical protein [Bradyrhizobium sp. U87765 SZCCT0048]
MLLIDILIVASAVLFAVAVCACALTGRPSSVATQAVEWPRRKRRAF